jgi:putative chitinase
MITTAQWLQILVNCGVTVARASQWAAIFQRRVQPEYLNLGLRELDDFLGQVLYETSNLSRLEEDLNYGADRIRQLGNASPEGSRWRSLVPIADQISHNPRAFANAAYGGRLGNTAPDDGFRYAGKGIPQVTGKANYQLLEQLTGLPLVAQPQMLADPDAALRCGVLWWEKKVPDSAIDSVERVTRAVNGGTIGMDDRATLTKRAALALNRLAT